MIENRPVPRDWQEPAVRGGEEPHPMRTLQDRMNDLFEEMWQKIGKHHTGVSGRVFTGGPPHTDLSEGNADWRLEIETPGMEEEHLEILVGDDQLTIKGEKMMEREETGRSYHLSERAFGHFSRRFDLPGDVDPERAKARYRNGVLTITIPKKAGAKSARKKIPIAVK
jgi:HSP20 family protein